MDGGSGGEWGGVGVGGWMNEWVDCDGGKRGGRGKGGRGLMHDERDDEATRRGRGRVGERASERVSRASGRPFAYYVCERETLHMSMF